MAGIESRDVDQPDEVSDLRRARGLRDGAARDRGLRPRQRVDGLALQAATGLELAAEHPARGGLRRLSAPPP